MENENEQLQGQQDTPPAEEGQQGEGQQNQGEGEGDNQGLQKQPDEEQIPDSYDYSSIKLPEGMELDKELSDEFSNIAKEVGLSQSKADKFMNLGVKLSGKIQTTFTEQVKQLQQDRIKSFETMLNTDPEIGGANLKQTLLEANEAYDAFVSKEAADLLAEAGLNKHPAIVKVFRDIGKQIKQDSIYNGNNAKHERTAADWYPSMVQKQ